MVHIEDHEARSPLMTLVQGPGSTSMLDAFLCYLSFILKHSDTKRDTKKMKSMKI